MGTLNSHHADFTRISVNHMQNNKSNFHGYIDLHTTEKNLQIMLSTKYLTRIQNNRNHHKKSQDSVELTNQDTENMLTKIHDNKGSQRNEALKSVQLMTTAHHTGRKPVYQTYNKFVTHILHHVRKRLYPFFIFFFYVPSVWRVV